MPTERGKVKWFNDIKGYGFIIRSTGEDVFVHYTAIEGVGFRSLYEGQEVEFECIKGPKGLLAKDVIRLDRTGRPADELNDPGFEDSIGNSELPMENNPSEILED